MGYALRVFFFFLSFLKSAPVILFRGFATRAIFFCLVVKTRGMALFSCTTLFEVEVAKSTLNVAVDFHW